MTNLGSIAMAMATLGQIGLCVSLLLMSSGKSQTWKPLCAFFLACAIVIADPVIVAFMPSARLQAIALTLPAYLIMAPALWLYVEGLTSETQWKIGRKHARHFVPFVLGLLVAALVMGLPQPTLEQIFFEEDLGGSRYLGVLFTAAFILIMGLIAQSGFYVVKILATWPNIVGESRCCSLTTSIGSLYGSMSFLLYLSLSGALSPLPLSVKISLKGLL